jgi:hypothetical protein
VGDAAAQLRRRVHDAHPVLLARHPAAHHAVPAHQVPGGEGRRGGTAAMGLEVRTV